MYPQEKKQLKEALYKLRGGITLMGAHLLVTRCKQLAQWPEESAIRELTQITEDLHLELLDWLAETTKGSAHPA